MAGGLGPTPGWAGLDPVVATAERPTAMAPSKGQRFEGPFCFPSPQAACL